MELFGDHLAQAIKRAGFSRREFAERVGYAPQNLHQVIRADRKPPLDRIDRWLEVLGSAVPDPARFRELAALEHTPGVIRDLVERLKAERRKPH